MKRSPAQNLAMFESAPVPQAFLVLTIPTVLSKVVMILYNLVDTWFIAATNDTALVAAVSLCAPILSFLSAIGDVWGVGGSSLIARLFGSGDRDRAREASALCFYGGVVCGVLAGIGMLVLEEPMLALLGADERTWGYASVYYRICALGAPVIVLNIVPMHLLRTEGLAGEAMMGSFVGAVAHVALVPVLIFLLDLGIAGAAWATVLGYVVTLGVYLWYMARKCGYATMDIRALRLRGEVLSSVLSIGVPASLTTLMQSVGLTLTNRFLLLYGTEQVAAYGIATKLVGMMAVIQVGFSFGAQPLIGYNYARTDRTRFREILKFSYGFMSAVCALAGVVIWLAAPGFMAGFLEDAAVISAGISMVRWQIVGVVFSGIVMVGTAVFRSAGKPIQALLLAVSRQGLVYAVILAAAHALLGYNGILAAQALTDLLTTVLSLLLLRPVWRS